MNDSDVNNELFERDGELVIRVRIDGREIPVRPVWARPLSGRGREVALLDNQNREVALLPDIAALGPESRALLQKVLGERYLLPRINRILGLRAHLGVLLWSVETDHGRRRFTTKDPESHVTRVGSDTYIIRDITGNRYEIESLSSLDRSSRAHADILT